jgi:hypothetical protein
MTTHHNALAPFKWIVDVRNVHGDFVTTRESVGHLEDPNDESRTLCGRKVPEDSWTDGTRDLCCKRCRKKAEKLGIEVL